MGKNSTALRKNACFYQINVTAEYQGGQFFKEAVGTVLALY